MSGEHESEFESQLESNAKAVFEASVSRLDGATRSRLAQARAAAVEAARDGGARRGFRVRRIELVGLAAAAALAFAVVWLPSQSPQPAVELAGEIDAFDDLDILLDDEELDLFEELEFYAWLDAQAALEAGGADGSG